MEITGSSTATRSGYGVGGARTTGGSEMGRSDFLHLLITQLRYQDPLDPMDNQAFVAQLAQFSSLEMMERLNTSFEDNLMLTQSLNNTAATGLIGNHVRAQGDTFELGELGGASLGYFLTEPAQSVTLTIYNELGIAVHSLVATEGDVGDHAIHWDGANIDGEPLPAGTYTVKVSATDAEGEQVVALPLVRGLVEGVTYRGGSAYLLVNGRSVALADVLEVLLPGSEGGEEG